VAPRARPTVRQRSVPVPARGHLQATERDGNETPCANRQHSHFIASLFTPDRKNTEQSLCFCTLDFSILPERANRITPFVSIVRLRTCLVQYTGRRILSSKLLHRSENFILYTATPVGEFSPLTHNLLIYLFFGERHSPRSPSPIDLGTGEQREQ
jgi:hypothetical protein